MNADFTLSIGVTNTTIVITDASTANYGGETITSRHLEIQDASGVVTTVAFPLITGVGDRISYDLVTPKAVTIKIVVVPSVANGSSSYNKTYSYVNLQPFEAYMQSLEDNIVFNIDPKSILASSTTIIREFEWAQALFDAATSLSSTGEIGSAQKCINSLIELSKSR